MTITQDTSAPLIAVVGATGLQGGSVVLALAESDRPYRIRGLTRDSTKEAAKKLAEKGVEIVQINLSADNKEGAIKAFEGATYVFAVTNFWEHLNMQREIDEGKMIVDAALAANIKLFIWSSLTGYTELSNGKLTNVQHCDSKAAITHHAEKVGIPFTQVQAGMYMQNFSGNVSAPRKQPDGSFVVALPIPPETLLPLVDIVNDYGLWVREAIESPRVQQSENGAVVSAIGHPLAAAEVVKQLAEITGKKITFVQLTGDQFKAGATASGLPEYVAQDLFEMFSGFVEFHDFGNLGESYATSLKNLARPPHTWAEFVKATDWSHLN